MRMKKSGFWRSRIESRMNAMGKQATLKASPIFPLIVLMIACALLVTPATASSALRVTFIDVGQGDCALVTCGNETMLVDTGPVGAWRHIAEAVGEEIEIDCLVLTHPHLDHIGNAARIIERNSVGRVMLPPVEYGTKAYAATMAAIDEADIECIYPAVGDVFHIGEAEVTVYGPHPVAYPEANDWSIVLMIEYAGRSILLTGDAEAAAEGDMLAYDDVLPLRADALKVAHHGSDTSSTFDFISAVAPRYAIVSCDSTEDRSYPSVETAMTLYECGVEDVFTTEVCGDVTIVITKSGTIHVTVNERDG